jgi:phosphomannomutase/phosphoglucomutase
MINPHIFREYDIRGVVDVDLSDEVVYQLAQGFGTYLRQQQLKKISLGGDVRLSTERFRGILLKGFRQVGIDVIDIGIVPTPVQYYSMYNLPVDGGLMITGSHNPPEYNGFKLTVQNAPVYGAEIQKIRQIIEAGKFASGQGAVEKTNLIPAYIEHIKKDIHIKTKLKVVLDSGNGAAALVAHRLFKELGVETVDLFDTPDGHFPNHHPDPTVLEYLHDLIESVRHNRADLGIGYDGDGDRLGVIDERGQVIWGDRLLIIFGRDIIRQQPGAKVIFEVKCSQALPEMIEKIGGQPIMWKTGHSLLKEKMKETGAPLAGEMSGHLFFADRYYGYDDAIYASARLVELLSHSRKPLSALLSDVPQYFSTPEIRVNTVDDEEKFKIAQQAKDYFSTRYDVIDLDGVRILFGDGWGLVRASNTQPVLVLRFEARSPQRLEEIKNMVIVKLKEFGKLEIGIS